MDNKYILNNDNDGDDDNNKKILLESIPEAKTLYAENEECINIILNNLEREVETSPVAANISQENSELFCLDNLNETNEFKIEKVHDIETDTDSFQNTFKVNSSLDINLQSIPLSKTKLKIKQASFETDLDDICGDDDYNDNGKQFLDYNSITPSQLSTDKFQEISSNSNRAILNVGGIKHEVLWKTLDRLPRTRLGRLKHAKTTQEILDICDDYNMYNNEYFFDRHPRSFTNILNFYRTGKLHLIEDVCVMSFQEDLNYWGIQEFYLALCCQHTYNQKKEVVLEEIRKEEEVLKERRADTFTSCCPSARKKVWDMMENPHTSKIARVSFKFD
jgi:hypothetical protein